MPAVAIASPLRLATDVGNDVGRRGGNAIDAALTTAAMLTVAYPASCGVGGDLLALVRDPDGRITFINASGRSPAATDADAVRGRFDHMPGHGPLTITVPGVLAGWRALLQHGAARPWAELLEPATSAAADGFAVSPGLAHSIGETTSRLDDYPDLAALLAPAGQPLTAGQTLRQPALARTLQSIADAGAGVLYDGAVGDALCAGLNARGVPMTTDDLHAFSVDESTPLDAEAAGWRVFAGRPNSQAYLVPRLLGMLASINDAGDVPLHRRLSADRLALAFVLASRERDAVLGDVASMKQDVEELLTPDAVQSFAQRLTAHPLDSVGAAAPTGHPSGDTVAVVASDDEGRSVSLIQSLYNGFGSLVLEPTTGILLHNRGACFVLDPTSPNALAPRKRPLHTLSPVLAESVDGTERLVVGTMGGHQQPAILTQVFSRLFAGESAQRAVSAPRLAAGSWDDHETSDTVAWEDDLDPAMVTELENYPGPRVTVGPHQSRMGHAHAIRVTASGMEVGTDPRADGL